MMNDLQDESFEDFLKQSADDLRMQPPAYVWKNLEEKMNKRRRKVFITSGLFLLTASLLGFFAIKHPKPVPVSIYNQKGTTSTGIDKPDAAKAPDVPLPLSLSSAQATNNNNDNSKTIVANRGSLTVASLFGKEVNTQKNSMPANTAATIVDEYTPLPANIDAAVNDVALTTKPTTNGIPGIESVFNTYKPKRKKHKPEIQFYFTPTVSYRKLSENKTYLRTAVQNGAILGYTAYQDVNSVVTHRPDLGFELGFTAKHRLTKKVKLRTGLQFNMNRYDIKTYNSPPEMATIALNSRSRGRVDSLNTISNLRNYNGYRSDWQQNTYFQISAPLGVEVTLGGNKHRQFGVATTLQPTYVIGERAFLITSDYKRYANVPKLVRHWNANVTFETFMAYATGKLKWQVGPQVRYQLLSSFVSEYPVKENLFDFGLKVGVSLNK